MSGLDSAQLDELEQMISDLLGAPWNKGTGRPRELTMREAIIVTCGYARNNITEEIWAEIFDVDQSTVAAHHLPDAIDRTGNCGGPAIRRGGGGGCQGRDRPGRRHLVALLVMERRA